MAQRYCQTYTLKHDWLQLKGTMQMHLDKCIFANLVVENVVRPCTKHKLPRYWNPFLPGLLQWIFLGGIQDATPLKDYAFEQAELLQIPEVLEPDSGPTEIWRWSHLELGLEQFVWSIHCRELRAWGYVMWDNARLNESDIYSQLFTLPPLPHEQELERRKDATIASMVKRRQLFREGAKGWWAKGDESHLEWGKPPQFSDDEEDWEEQFIELISDL